jgi:hypothetical protein
MVLYSGERPEGRVSFLSRMMHQVRTGGKSHLANGGTRRLRAEHRPTSRVSSSWKTPPDFAAGTLPLTEFYYPQKTLLWNARNVMTTNILPSLSLSAAVSPRSPDERFRAFLAGDPAVQ